jgi:hypothetical protein
MDRVTRYRGDKKRSNRGWTAGEELEIKERRYEKVISWRRKSNNCSCCGVI